MLQVTAAALRSVIVKVFNVPARLDERPAKRRRVEKWGDAFVNAAYSGHKTSVLRMLVDGVDRGATGSKALTPYLQGETALVAALKGESETRSRSVVQLLLAAGANCEDDSADGHRPLMVAARKGKAACVETLLAVGAKVDVQNEQIPVSRGGGYTALHFAACKHLGVGSDAKRSRIVAALLEAGANKTLVDMCGMTARQLAQEGGHVKVVELLQED